MMDDEVRDHMWPQLGPELVSYRERYSAKVVGFDKDHTMARVGRRRLLIPEILEGSRPWLDYSRACADDKPVEVVRELMHVMSLDHRVVVMSGATDCPEARAWLRDHRFPCYDVLMRQEGDESGNAELKVRWIKEIQRRGYTFLMFVDDYEPVAETIERETGVPVLLLNPRIQGGYEAGDAVGDG